MGKAPKRFWLWSSHITPYYYAEIYVWSHNSESVNMNGEGTRRKRRGKKREAVWEVEKSVIVQKKKSVIRTMEIETQERTVGGKE